MWRPRDRLLLTQTFGAAALIHHSHVHKLRNILEHLPDAQRPWVQAIVARAHTQRSALEMAYAPGSLLVRRSSWTKKSRPAAVCRLGPLCRHAPSCSAQPIQPASPGANSNLLTGAVGSARVDYLGRPSSEAILLRRGANSAGSRSSRNRSMLKEGSANTARGVRTYPWYARQRPVASA
jgi:hypothetical protein